MERMHNANGRRGPATQPSDYGWHPRSRHPARIPAVQALEEEVGIVTDSDVMAHVLTQVQNIAATEATVLLTGESGTGKGVVARVMHRCSARCDRPFVLVNCPSLSAELLESELFGHRRGAFTGAVSDHAGRVSQAHGGTLFLDEIGDVPMELQPKLLRFVQDREFERIGDPATCQADVRLVAATNHDLPRMMESGRFRDDLYHRLNVISIELPPLRQRREDILPLARLFADHFASVHGRPGVRFRRCASKALVDHSWPGNIRELRNLIERLVVLSDDGLIDATGLGLDSPTRSPRPSRPAAGDPVSLQALEAAHIEAVLEHSDSLETAARILGIHPSTLWRKRKRAATGSKRLGRPGSRVSRDRRG